MAKHCSSCNVALYGDEVGAGVCETCAGRGITTTSGAATRTAVREPYPPEGRDRDDEEFADLKRRPARAGDWRTFRTGVLCHRWSVILNLIGVAVSFALGVAAAGGRNQELAVVGQVVSNVVSLVTLLLFVVSLCLLCTAPASSGVRGLALTSLVCYLLAGVGGFALFGTVLYQAISGIGGGGFRGSQLPIAPEVLLGAFGGLAILFLAAYVCHFRAYSRAAEALGDQPLADSFTRYLTYTVVLPLAALGFVALLAFAGGGGAAALLAGVFGCGGLVAVIVFLVWLLSILNRLAEVCEPPLSGVSDD